MKRVFFFLSFNIVFPVLLLAQIQDTSGKYKKPSPSPFVADSTFPINTPPQSFLAANKFLNSSGIPVSAIASIKKIKSKDTLFYILAGLVFMLAFFRYFFARYFSNLFRVFFNNSFRQSQLTDQLLQAKLPSLLFNLFFVITGGIYVYLILQYYHWINEHNLLLATGLCTGLLGITYCIKYCTLKFTGWVTGYAETVNTYIFITFLINKIVGIILIPFIIIIAFSDIAIVKFAVILSLLVIGLFYLIRFLRSYGILQNQLKISKFHFFLYILGIELLPLLLIYKGLMILLSNNQ